MPVRGGTFAPVGLWAAALIIAASRAISSELSGGENGIYFCCWEREKGRVRKEKTEKS
jgi:hypothetical protein